MYQERPQSKVWTRDELISYCRTHIGDEKALNKVGLSIRDAQTYLKIDWAKK